MFSETASVRFWEALKKKFKAVIYLFREMRRIKQQLSKEDCEDILLRGKTGVLAVLGDGGYPYTVPINYYYTDGKIYLHCAKTGH